MIICARVPCLCECLHLPFFNWGFCLVFFFVLFWIAVECVNGRLKWKVSLRALVVVAYEGKAAFAHTRQEEWCSGFIQINLEALSWGAYCIYLAAALRYRSDRQAGEAKQHAQISQTRVTLSGPPNDPQQQHCIPVDLRLIRQFTHSFSKRSRGLLETQNTLESQYPTARLDGKRHWLIVRTEQRLNYCQRSLRVLTLASVQIYSTREQSTLRHISQPDFCSTRQATKLSKHCEMYS